MSVGMMCHLRSTNDTQSVYAVGKGTVPVCAARASKVSFSQYSTNGGSTATSTV